MGLFNSIFGKQKNDKRVMEYFKMLNSYTPVFYSFNGGVYESELTRSAIHAKAKHTAKLKPAILGNAYKNLEKTLQTQPNEFQSTYEFLYRLRTYYEVDTYTFIIPIEEFAPRRVVGFYPLKATQVELLEDSSGQVWLRYTFANGQKAVIEYDRVGVLSKMAYKSEFLGDGNNVLNPTMSMLDLQKQGIEEGIKQGAMIRFMAKIGRTLSPDDLQKERSQFTMTNLSSDNNTGVMIYDAKYENVNQIESKPFIIDDKQMNYIKNNVYSYFGVNEDILQNKFNEDVWNAFYEGEIEPFAIQLSLAMTNMLFTPKEKAYNNEVHFSANRLQYASNKTKLDVSVQLFDRGIFGTDDIAEIWNMPKTGENKKYIRKEYAQIENLDSDVVEQVEVEEDVET